MYESLTLTPTEEEVVEAAMRWHFNEQTGSRYWLNKRFDLAFDPLSDVKRFSDLQLFDDVSSDWKTLPMEDLIPKAMFDQLNDFHIFESGGTTGNPKRIVEHRSRKHALNFVQSCLEMHGYNQSFEGHWLHIGPTGPHIVGRTMKALAQQNQRLCFQVDFDPRWVKKLILNKQIEQVEQYKAHLLEQAFDLIKTQNISVMFVTPPILESICKDPVLHDAFKKKIKFIIWAGTSISPETYRLITELYFPDCIFMGLYGNTMMGIAPQRPAEPEDEDLYVYQTYSPYCHVQFFNEHGVVDVPYGEYGQIAVSLLTPEMLIPFTLERDYAKRVKPAGKFKEHGITNVGPMPNTQLTITEGVY
ncbi:hypothetical protein [Pseudoalteromonas tunicata]|jgi:phenylacetate-coenzyme A ligase PaaK-like adenylate-forming protein|uniref:Phenazine biosynthesis protein n=1 Tax=Pseudoalteromonas tunicata D2 TaxID=87626 RepID=A4C852_9GAMM|nr:hypothetical protein [Pseudoalteromonas tunicata]AXT32329.1 hypothetical protein D1819_16850 [Pseudoalteromonas tunicata]EAR28767.1 hypothetical protein PTD2_06984 [Pseudoalteromonas tunicata D2]